MNVLIVTGIFPPDVGGPSSFVAEIAYALGRRGHRVVVATLADNPMPRDSHCDFTVVRIPRTIGKGRRWLRSVRLLIQLGCRADVLFVNGLALEAVLANRVLKKPMVLKVVGDLAWERATNRRQVTDTFEQFQVKRHTASVEVVKALRRWWTLQADHVIVPSAYLARAVEGWGVPRARLSVIHNAVSSRVPSVPAEIPIRAAPIVVTAGRLILLKQVDRLLEAVGRILNLGIVVVGDGPERAHLEQVAAHSLPGRAWFAGQRNRSETLSFIGAGDIFALNSSHEGFPHVLLEAMHLGRPVVATRVGGVPEIVRHGHSGLLVPSRDDDMLEAALRALVEDPSLRERMGAAAAKDSSRFGVNHMVDATEAILLQTAAIPR